MSDAFESGVCAPLVSVIIPAYNRVNYIRQTVDSVLEQSYCPVELIVVDDGSNDGTYELLQSYGDRLSLLTHPGRVNKGQSAAINRGLAIARGKYIAVLDSDDYWELDKLEKQVAFLEAHPDVGLVYGNGRYVDGDGHYLHDVYGRAHAELNDVDQRLLDCYILLPNNSLVRKSVYDQVGTFEEAFRSAQDHDMLVRVGEVTRFAYMPDYVFCYRRHGGSISANSQDVRWRTGFEILRRAAARYPYRRSTLRKRRALLHYRMAQVAARAGQWHKVLFHGALAGVLDPLRAFRVATGMEKKT